MDMSLPSAIEKIQICSHDNEVALWIAVAVNPLQLLHGLRWIFVQTSTYRHLRGSFGANSHVPLRMN